MPIIEKIKKLIADLVEMYKGNKIGFLWLVSAVIIVLIFIFSIISLFFKPATPDALIDIPLQNYPNQRITIQQSVISNFEFEEKELEVYSIVERNNADVVDRFLTKISKSLNRQNVSNIIILWTSATDFAQYDVSRDEMFFRFSEPLSLTEIPITIVTNENAKQYLDEFVSKYLQLEYEYTNVKLTKVDSNFRIEANRSIEGYPLHVPGVDTYSDYLLVEPDGDIVEGRLRLINYTTDGVISIKPVHPTNLNRLISRTDYPKEVNQDFPDGLEKEQSERDAPGDIDENALKFPKVTNTVGKELSIVYFFATTDYKKLVPVYYIKGEGEILFETKTYVVPMTVYVNALDPERVYVPENTSVDPDIFVNPQ